MAKNINYFWYIFTPLALLWFCASFYVVCYFGASTRGLALLLVAPVAVVGLYFSSKRTTALESQNKIDSNRLLAETFAKSIELLGNEKEVVRQGAIYALGKLAGGNSEELTVIVNTLCAFIRHEQSFPDDKNDLKQRKFNKLSIDIEAAIKTIVKLSHNFESNAGQDGMKYDLSNIYLPHADFSHAQLFGFNMSDVHFQECIFENVDFSNSNLIGSTFAKSSFKNANFNELSEIMKVDFSTTEGLGQEVISIAQGDGETKLPEGITKPEMWNISDNNAP